MNVILNIALCYVSAMLFSGLFEIHAQDDCSLYANCTDCVTNSNCSWFSCFSNATEENEIQLCAQIGLVPCDNNETATELNCSAVDAATTTLSPTDQTDITTVTSTINTGTAQATTQQPPVTVIKYKKGFDAASFIGGIILCGGLIAIGLIGYKCYQSRQGKDYSTF